MSQWVKGKVLATKYINLLRLHWFQKTIQGSSRQQLQHQVDLILHETIFNVMNTLNFNSLNVKLLLSSPLL